jgi:hypothetical protein
MIPIKTRIQRDRYLQSKRNELRKEFELSSFNSSIQTGTQDADWLPRKCGTDLSIGTLRNADRLTTTYIVLTCVMYIEVDILTRRIT